ncbi:MAG: hypothetical protein AAF631_09235 [Pseudomonadota bacterium]
MSVEKSPFVTSASRALFLAQPKRRSSIGWKVQTARALLIGALTLTVAAPVNAGRIERACNASDRSASRALCSCIQRVADQKLTRTDQRLAAQFFADPQLAQDTRQSDDTRKEAFWKRYKAFGAAATRSCR